MAEGTRNVRVGNATLVKKYYREAGLPTIWCPGCGIGVVVDAMVRAIDGLGLPQDEVVIATGIGCSGFIYNYLNFDGYHGTHGRALPAATGIKLANPNLKVIVPMGDGDCAAIGGNHFLHAARRNVDLTAIVINNSVYGMTGGQYSPMTPRNALASTAPFGHIEPALDICAVAQAAGATYIARTTTYHVRQMIKLIAAGIRHAGFSVIEVICQCPTHYGRRNRQSSAIEMLQAYRERAVSATVADTVRPEEGAERIVVGELFKVEGQPEYTAAYDEVIRKAQARASSEAPEAAVETILPARENRGRCEVQLAGIGGQGLALAGVILAEAAGVLEGRHVTQTEAHGINARGGPSRSELIISDQEIDYTGLTALDILLATQPADLARYLPSLKPDGMLIVDATTIREVPPTKASVYSIPLTAVARALGNEVLVGIIGLAAIAALSGVVSLPALKMATENNVPQKKRELNCLALAAGVDAAQQARAEAAQLVSPARPLH